MKNKKSQNHKHDPVCGMNVSDFTDAIKISHGKKEFYFCGSYCEERFKENPSKYQNKPLITLRDVKKSFNIGPVETRVLRGLDLHIWPGDFVAIIGASGSGKSTLLNMIGLLDRPNSGRIYLGDIDISRLDDDARANLRSKTFGFVFQQYNLIPWLTAYENVTMPLIFAKKKIMADALQARFEEMGIQHRMTHRPFELSGGEQQRVALLRALANDPEIILGDEPTGNLDSATGAKILEILMNLNKKRKKTLIVVTHDAYIAERANQVIALKDGQLTRNQRTHKKIYTE